MTDLKDFSMLGLFLMEAESQAQTLSEGLLELEKNPSEPSGLEALMRAAHSLKGGARIVQCDAVVKFAHAMEDYFVAVINQRVTLREDHVDRLLEGVDLIRKISETPEGDFNDLIAGEKDHLASLAATYRAFVSGETPAPAPAPAPAPSVPESPLSPAPAPVSSPAATAAEPPDDALLPFTPTTAAPPPVPERETPRPRVAAKEQFIKVAVAKMEALMGLAGESFVNVRNMHSVEEELRKLKKTMTGLAAIPERLHDLIVETEHDDSVHEALNEFRDKYNELCWSFTDFASEFSRFNLKVESFSDNLYNEVVSCKIMPFGELSKVFPRLVRDIAKELGKQVNFEISGVRAGIDRDLLEKLETSLNHLLRNAVDHGLETPEERIAAGKPAMGTIKLSAFHWAGMFNITITDDGRGIELDELRRHIVRKNLATPEMLENMPKKELLDFLFLPGFSTRSSVSEISGRGVGLDVVMSMVQEVKGVIDVDSKPGEYTTFHLQLPITLSVIAALIVEIGGELYAFPSTRIDRLLDIPVSQIKTIENHQYVQYDGRNLGVVAATEILDYPPRDLEGDTAHLMLLSDRDNQYALVVDGFIREERIVVRPLDERLGKIPCLNAASVLSDGAPVLIADVDDIVRSVDNHIKSDSLHKLHRGSASEQRQSKKVLVIDDSITVRELEKHILESNGYQVETAVNGVDGWNAVRTDTFDLIITDIDMPRMNGFELVEKIKGNNKLRSIPVIIISYKDREEDKIKGIECGADYYLTKSSFHDNTMIEAVYQLIGEPHQ